RQRDRPRAHGEDVAADAAHAGRRALVRLDERRVVVRLHLEDDRLAVADVDDAGVLARPLDDARPARRQPAQVNARRLARALRAPHHREDAEPGVRRQAPEDLRAARDLLGGESMLGGEGRRDDGLLHRAPTLAGVPAAAATALSKRRRPSSPPSPRSASTARSGCGMRPTTFPRALVTPPTLALEPVGVASGASRPAG